MSVIVVWLAVLAHTSGVVPSRPNQASPAPDAQEYHPASSAHRIIGASVVD